MSNDTLFAEVHDRVSALAAAELYGLQFGRNKRAVCPWHKDTHPDLAFYSNGARCYCHACHAGGDAIALTAQIFGESSLEAARRLNNDFHLGITGAGRPSAKRNMQKLLAQRKRELEQWAKQKYCRLCDIEQKSQHALDKLSSATEALPDGDTRLDALDALWDNARFVATLRANARAGESIDALLDADIETMECMRNEANK